MADLSKSRIFEDAVRSYYGRTVSFVEKYCRDKNIAEDIAQNTFVTIWNNLDEISVDKPPPSADPDDSKEQSLQLAQAREDKGQIPRLHRGKGFGCDEQATLFEGHINITKRIGSSAFCHPSLTWHCQLGLRLRNLKAIEGFQRCVMSRKAL
jgi:hypothetical protein